MIMKRLPYIDSIKGFLLVLICFSHYGDLPNFIEFFVSPVAAYYVPMFFILSGFLFNSNRGFREFLKRKYRSLLVPYLFFLTIFIILDWNIYINPNVIYDIVIGGLSGAGTPKAQPLYFIYVLFWSSIVCYPIIKMSSQYKIAFMIILAILAWHMSQYSIPIPCKIDVVISAAVFMIGGILIRKILSKIHPNKILPLLIIGCIVGMVGFFINLGDFHLNRISFFPLNYICPIFLTLSLLLLFRLLDIDGYSAILSAISINGIIILSTHFYLIIIFSGIFRDLPLIFDFILKTLFISATLYYFIIPLSSKYLCKLFGRDKSMLKLTVFK